MDQLFEGFPVLAADNINPYYMHGIVRDYFIYEITEKVHKFHTGKEMLL